MLHMPRLQRSAGPMFGHNLNPIANGMHRLGMGNPFSMRPHFAPGGLSMPSMPQVAPQQAALALARQQASQGPQARGPAPQPPPQIRRAPNGDPIHTGAINSPVAGRTDHLNLTVPTGSYVIPADVVNHYGQDNSSAGHQIMEALFRSGAIRRIHAHPVVQPNGDHTPIAAAGGEYIVAPEAVAHIGGGSIQKGHAILDSFVMMSRAEHIKTLKKLPGPAGSDKPKKPRDNSGRLGRKFAWERAESDDYH